MKKNKGFLMIEILITLAIFSLVISSLNKYVFNILNENKILFKDIHNIENEIYFMDSLINDIFLRDVNFDILNFDILVYDNILIYCKNNMIIKYEFKDSKILVSSKKKEEKYFKKSIVVSSCDNLFFKREFRKLSIYLENKGKFIYRVINL